MEIGFHKTKQGQDIISRIGLLTILLFIISCSSTKPFQLTDVSPKYREFQGTDLDPGNGKTESIVLTKNQIYDDFILKANKSIRELEFAETVAQQGENKKANNEPIQREMNAAGYILEDLPNTVAELPSLRKKNIELIEASPNDFEGPSMGKVGSELARIQEKLNVLTPKSEKILQSLKNLRSDSSNYSTTREAEVKKEETPQDTKSDPIILTETVESKPVENKKEDKKDKNNKSKIAINRVPKKNKVTGTTKDLFKEEIRQIEDTLSDDERKEKEYTEKIRSGLVEVFKWEYFRKPKNLEKLLITHPIPRVRSAAALALGRLKAGRIALHHAIDKDGYQVRPAAYKALSELGDKKSLAYFLSGTKAEDIEVIAASYEGLGKTKDPAGRELIISQGLNSEYVIVVASSIRGLAYNKVPGDVSLLEKFLKSAEEPEIKDAAVEALSIHGSREALRVLEENVKEQPELSAKILEAIGKNPSLAATFSLIRLNEIIEDEKLTKLIGENLLRKKAFGKYAIVLVQDDFLRLEPNERSRPVSYVKAKEIGLVLGESKKEFAVRLGEEIITDKYMQLKMESTIPGSRSPFTTGWIFYPKIEIIEVKKLGDDNEEKYSNLKKGKHQNIFNPIKDKTKEKE
ncbi:MAG: HEAT repeat domain-containing protein [Leptospira sp.]|nr:HEAT repeat domain-containing protein [Leptospira sp.]